jgi:hypothetical protein
MSRWPGPVSPRPAAQAATTGTSAADVGPRVFPWRSPSERAQSLATAAERCTSTSEATTGGAMSPHSRASSSSFTQAVYWTKRGTRGAYATCIFTSTISYTSALPLKHHISGQPDASGGRAASPLGPDSEARQRPASGARAGVATTTGAPGRGSRSMTPFGRAASGLTAAAAVAVASAARRRLAVTFATSRGGSASIAHPVKQYAMWWSAVQRISWPQGRGAVLSRRRGALRAGVVLDALLGSAGALPLVDPGSLARRTTCSGACPGGRFLPSGSRLLRAILLNSLSLACSLPVHEISA